MSQLYEAIRPIAAAIRTRCHKLLSYRARLVGELLPNEHYAALADSAVFDAFIELGGDVDHPETFPWEAEQERLTRVAAQHLRNQLVGRESEYGDIERRITPRTWNLRTESYPHSFPQTIKTQSELLDVPEDDYRGSLEGTGIVTATSAVEEDDADTRLAELPQALRAALRPIDYQLLSERYLEGLSIYAQVAKRMWSDSTYAALCPDRTPAGFEALCTKLQEAQAALNMGAAPRTPMMDAYETLSNRINVAVHRARKRAKQVLGDEWRALAGGRA